MKISIGKINPHETLLIFVIILFFWVGVIIQRNQKLRLYEKEAVVFSQTLTENLKLHFERDRAIFEALETQNKNQKLPFRNIYTLTFSGRYAEIDRHELAFQGYRGQLASDVLLEEIANRRVRGSHSVLLGPLKRNGRILFALVQAISTGYRVAELDWQSYLKRLEEFPKGFYFFPEDISGSILMEYPFLKPVDFAVNAKRVRIANRKFQIYRFQVPEMNLRFSLLIEIPSLLNGDRVFLLLFLFALCVAVLLGFLRIRWEEKDVDYPLFLLERQLLNFHGDEVPDFSLIEAPRFLPLKKLLEDRLSELILSGNERQQNNQILATFFEVVSQPVIMIDRDFNLILENLKFREVFLKKWHGSFSLKKLLNRDQVDKIVHLMDVEKFVVQHLELHLKVNGSYLDYKIKLVSVKKDNEEMFLLIWENQTEMNHLKHRIFQFQQTNLQLSMVHGIAHDLKHELTVALGILEMQLLNAEAKPEMQSLKSVIVRSGDLVKTLLEPHGKRRVALIDIDLKELLQDVIQLVEKSLLIRFSICLEMSLDSYCVRVDRTYFRQMLYNIFLKINEDLFRNENLIMKIKMSQSSISSEEKKNLNLVLNVDYAEVDFRLERDSLEDVNLKKVAESFQLELSEAQEILNQFGAKILTEKKSNEDILELKLFIPLAGKEEKVVEGSPQTEKNEGVLKNLKVLIVDDEALVRKISEKFLLREGCEIQVADNGWKAKEQLKDFQPDMILSDVRMPEYDGFYLLAYLEEHHLRIPVLLMSAYFELFNSNEIQYKGFEGILDKPFTYDQLIQRVSEIAIKLRQKD